MTKKIKTENNMSSSGLTRRSRNKDLHADWMPDQVGHDRKEEQGRSMVEMLGTLAIIGVLSVGGIAGYTYGMNKYYANELLAGASARAVIVASQLASGRESSLSEFDKMKDTAGGTFDGTVKEFDDGIGIKVSGVQKAVCENLIKDTEGTDIGIETEAGGEVTCGDENTFFITFDSLGVSGGETNTEPECDPACPTGQECIGGVCATVTGECSNNGDCDEWCDENGGGEKCYCAINAAYTGNDSACWNNFTGQCAVAEKQSGVTGGYTVFAGYTNWFSAVNFCKAHGQSLVSLADLGITGGYHDDASCSGSECMGTVDWADLRNKIGDTLDFYWTADAVSRDADWNFKAGSNNNSCTAFNVNLSSGAVNHYTRSSDFSSYYALCEQFSRF